MFFLAALAGMAGGVVCAQEPPPAHPLQPPLAPMLEEAVQNASAPCVQPVPMVRLEDYNGPFNKVVGAFARRLERKAVHPPHYKPGAKLCTLKLKDKFLLFVEDSFDPVTFLATGVNAGIDQALDTDPSFGQGAEGYGRRYGGEFIDQASSTFFKDFAYPWLFSEDPRYYRLAHGTGRRRFLHALRHAVVAHRDNGESMFNFSEWFGTVSGVALSNTYHPDNQRGFSPAAQRVGYSVLQDMGSDVLREFWPEISRKFRLPFRPEPLPPSPGSSPAAR